MLRESPLSSQVCTSPQTCVLFALKEERRYFHPAPGLLVAHSGAGARNAARATSELLSSCTVPPALLIICGFAGGLSPDMKPGYIVVADRVLEIVDTGLKPRSPSPPGPAPSPGSGPLRYAHSPALDFLTSFGGRGGDGSVLKSTCVDSGANSTPYFWDAVQSAIQRDGNTQNSSYVVHQGALVTTDRVLIRTEEKQELAERTGALAVDMETAAAAHVAEVHGVSWMAIRVITDGVEDEMPLDFNLLTGADDNIDIRRVVWATLTHPWKIPDLIRLGKRADLASRNLATFLETFLFFGGPV